MINRFVLAFIGALLVAVLFDYWLSNMEGFIWFAEINWGLGASLLGLQQLLIWFFEAAVVVFVSYPRRAYKNSIARAIRMGLIFGLICVMICHINLAVHLDRIPVDFLIESLMLFSLLNTMKFIAMVGVVFLLFHHPQLTNQAVKNR